MDREAEQEPVYSVGFVGNTALLKIKGRAVYTNCAPVSDFFNKCSQSRIVVDFKDCQGMDSTFMGILAGTAMEIRKRNVDNSHLILVNLSDRNIELVKNLGLHMICEVELETNPTTSKAIEANTESLNDEDAANKNLILEAHETLAGLNAKNAKAFKEVLTYMRQKAEQERPVE